jgi:hypothetical protein
LGHWWRRSRWRDGSRGRRSRWRDGSRGRRSRWRHRSCGLHSRLVRLHAWRRRAPSRLWAHFEGERRHSCGRFRLLRSIRRKCSTRPEWRIGEPWMIRFGDLLGRLSRLECTCGPRRARRNRVVVIGRSEAERPSGHIRLNVVWLLQQRSPWPIHRHSLSAICARWGKVDKCRASTSGTRRQPAQGCHVSALKMTRTEPAIWSLPRIDAAKWGQATFLESRKDTPT